MSEKLSKILTGIFSALVAIFILFLTIVNQSQDKLEIDLDKKVDKEVVDMNNRHLRDLIGKETEIRKDNDKAINNRVDRIEDREELRNIP